MALAGALVAFTGCGGSDKKSSSSSSNTAATTTPAASGGSGASADYQAGFKKVGTDFQSTLQTSLAKVGAGKTVGEKLAALDAVKQSVTKAADGFGALNPPANLKTENAALVGEMRSFATVIDDETTAIQNRDLAKLPTFKPRLRSINTKIQLTLARIQTKLGG
jgi:hypothetical protein